MQSWIGGKVFGWVTSMLGGVGGYVAVGLLAGALAFTAAWRYQAATYSAEISEMRAAYADAATEGLRRQAMQRAQQELRRDEIDKAKTRELEHARRNEKSLARAVAAGERRLHVAAQCPAGAGLPGAAGATGLDAAATAQLDPAARQDYFDLRDRIVTCEIQRDGLIDYVEMLQRRAEPAR